MFSYFITLQFLNRVSNTLGVKLTICIGLSINFIAVLFLSPVSFLPQSLVTIIIGLIILGMTGACVTIPSLIDFMDTMKIKMNMDENVANDVSSGMENNFFKLFIALYNLGVNIGDAIGPIFGGAITEYYTFSSACYFTSFLNLIYTCIFVFYNVNNIKEGYDNIHKISDNSEDYRELKSSVRKDSLGGTITFASKQRGYSFSNISSKKSSFAF
jgi:MFS family permease